MAGADCVSLTTTDTSSIVIASGEDFVYRNQSIISHHFEAQLSGRPLLKYEAKAIIGPAVTSPDQPWSTAFPTNRDEPRLMVITGIPHSSQQDSLSRRPRIEERQPSRQTDTELGWSRILQRPKSAGQRQLQRNLTQPRKRRELA